MKCEKAKLLINAHIDGELGEDLTIRVRDHLDGCDSCRREAVEVAAVVDRLRSVKRPAPAHLLSRVASDLQKSPTHTKVTNMKTKLSIAIGVAACAAVAALALRPTPAFADVNKIADNLQERDYVVITTDYSKEGPVPVHTAYRS